MLLVLVAILSLASQETLASLSSNTQNHHHHNHQHQQQQQHHHQQHHHHHHPQAHALNRLKQIQEPQVSANARVGGLDPSDYIDEAGELDVLVNQQQIPTAQLMSAAGHLVPDNFFLPGSSIPASLYAQQQRYLQLQQQQQQLQLQQLQQQQQQQQQQSQQQQQQQQQQDALQQVASQVQARAVPAPARYNQNVRALELLMAAAAEQQQQQQASQEGGAASQAASQLIDFNGYNLASQPDPRDAAAQSDLVELLGGPQAIANNQQAAAMLALYEQQLIAAQQQLRQEQQQQQSGEHSANIIDHMASMASSQQQDQPGDSEHYLSGGSSAASIIGPDYQLIGGSSSSSNGNQDYPSNSYESGSGSGGKSGQQDQQASQSSHQHHQNQHNQQGQQQQQQHNQQQQQQGRRPYGLPTKSSDKEPAGMLKPSGNPKTVSSPLIDFAANNLPKTTALEKLTENLPQPQTPTVFSFASSKDPSEKVKGVNQKKRNVMRQAEQLARLAIKSFNDKFGTTLGDQTDIPFLLSTLGPLGFAQNVLFDPSLLISLLNTAEKTYFSDVLPGPAKQAIRPVLNIFRVPNKKRDKANLLNIISYLTSGGQTAASVPSKHRQSFGIEKSSSKSHSNRDKHNR